MNRAIPHKDQKIMSFIKQALLSLLTAVLIAGQTTYGFAQVAAVLPPAVTQFFDNNGNPLSSGKVYTYIPGTTTPKTTWIDITETTPNTNPVILDAAGRAKILGQGAYRQVVTTSTDNLVFDAVTSSLGTGGPGATGDGDLVGTIKPWAGIIAPNQYAFAYGQEISRTTYGTLLTAITQTVAVTCSSGSPILTNVADTSQIPVGSKLELNCVAPGTTVLSKTALTVTLSANANLSIASVAVFFPFGNGNGSTTFNVPDLRGNIIAGRANMGGVASANLTSAFCAVPGSGATCGTQSHRLLLAELAAHTHASPTLSDTGHAHGVTDGVLNQGHLHTVNSAAIFTGLSASGGGVNFAGGVLNSFNLTIDKALSGVVVNNHTAICDLTSPGVCNGAGTNPTGIAISATTGAITSGTSPNTAFSIVQPTIQLNYIIKVSPDVATSISTGVTSLGSMIGDIACGNGLLCTGNIISVFGGGFTPGGPDGAVQFADAGTLGGSTNFLYTKATANLTLGFAANLTGSLSIAGVTSGNVKQTVQSVAGTPTVTWGTSSGTPAVTASSPLSITSATGNITCTSCITTGDTNTVTNTILAQSAAYTFKGNSSGGTTNVTDFTIDSLTIKASPAAGDKIVISDQSAGGALKYATVTSIGSAGSVGSVNDLTGAIILWASPQGRLTLTSGVPVLTTSVATAGTVYYTGYQGGKNVPIYNGTSVAVYQLCAVATVGPCEVSITLGSNWLAAHNYDLFIGLDSTTVRLCSGPAWNSATSRGTGAATTELEQLDGMYTNKVTMTCNYDNSTSFTCQAHECTYVGSMLIGAAGQTNWIYPAIGSTPTAGVFGIWNMYNRVNISGTLGDTTATWPYNSTTPRIANGNSTTARVSYIQGLAEDNLNVTISAGTIGGASGFPIVGVCHDVTNAFSGLRSAATGGGGFRGAAVGAYSTTDLGVHFVAWCEAASTAVSQTFIGNQLGIQSGMSFSGRF